MDYKLVTAPLPKPQLADPFQWPVIVANVVNSGPGKTPAIVSQYSLTSNVVVSNTDFGSLTDTGTFVGSLTIPPLSPGTVVKITASGSAISDGKSVNYALYVDGNQITNPTALGTFTGTNAVQINSYITVKAGSTSAFLQAAMDNVQPRSDNQLSIAWDQTLPHIIDIFAVINVASVGAGFTCTSFSVELSNAT